MANLTEQQIEEFSTALRGTLVQPHDPTYDAARSLWNAMIDRKPTLIVQCAGVGDVIQSVRFARQHNLPLAMRGAGHNIAGKGTCDDGLVIDMGPMNSVRIDPVNRRAHVEPGATLGDFDHEAQAFGLATPLGINSTTGVAGLTLGGGFGWLTRQYGMTVDNLVAADVVTADGELVRASAETNPDLFWAIRGGGGNFGVVTRFEFQLYPVGPEIFAGLLVFPGAEAGPILDSYRSYSTDMPDNLNVWAVLRKAPPLPFLAESVHGTDVVVLAIFFNGPASDGERLIAPLKSFGSLHGEHVGAMPYSSWQQAFDPLLTPGARNYWKSHNFSELQDGVLEKIAEYAGKLPTDQTEIFLGRLGGKANRVASDATAYSHRDAEYVMNVHARWEDAADDKRCIDWAREFFDVSAPFATGGVYINFMTEDETERVGAGGFGTSYQRLQQVKKKFDPENLFRINQNIQPAG